VVKAPTDKPKLVSVINRQSIFEWFEEQCDKLQPITLSRSVSM